MRELHADALAGGEGAYSESICCKQRARTRDSGGWGYMRQNISTARWEKRNKSTSDQTPSIDQSERGVALLASRHFLVRDPARRHGRQPRSHATCRTRSLCSCPLHLKTLGPRTRLKA